MAEFDYKIIYTIVSLAISAGFFLGVHHFFRKAFPGLKGVRKLTGFVSLGVVIGEIFYLGNLFNIFTLAIETILAVGTAFWLVALALQNYLKNVAAGLGNYLNPEIDVGRIIEINDKKGIIVDLGLTKTTILIEDGTRIFIPNMKFTEELFKVFYKKKLCKHFEQIKDSVTPKTEGCEECQKDGSEWVYLRMCLICGYIGCDRTSPGKHAQKHFIKTKHPIVVEFPTKRWKWCYIHDSVY